MTRTWLLKIAALSLMVGPIAVACSAPADDDENAGQTTQALPNLPIGEPSDPPDPPPPPPRDAGTHVIDHGPIVSPAPTVFNPDPGPIPPTTWRNECSTRTFFVKPVVNDGCANIHAHGATWTGSPMFPGTSGPFCRYQWLTRAKVAIDYNTLEAAAEIIPKMLMVPAHPNIKPDCTAVTCGVGDGACSSAPHADDPTPDGGHIIPNGVPLCPSCGWVMGNQATIILDPSMVNLPALSLTQSYSAWTFAPPAGQQTFVVQLAPGIADGTVISLYMPL